MRFPAPLLAAALAITAVPACTRTPGAAPGSPPIGCTLVPGGTLRFVCPFTVNIPNFVLSAPGAATRPGWACPVGSMLVSGATASGTDTVTWGAASPSGVVEDDGSKVRIASLIPDGTGTFVIAPVDATDATCRRTVDPPTTVPMTWVATHAARVDRTVAPNCTFQSSATFRSFALSPAGPLSTPAPVDVALRDSLEVRLDALVADQVDAVTRGSAHNPGVGARCAGWTRLAPGA